VECREHQTPGKRSLPIHAHADRVAAQVTAAGAAIAAVPARDMPLAGYAVADTEAAHLRTHPDHLADILVPDVHSDRNRLTRPLVPLPDMNVGAADRRLADLDQQVVVTHLRFLDPLQVQSWAGLGLHQCSHRRLSLSSAR